MGIVGILHNQIESEKFKMATAKPEMDVSQLIDTIETKFYGKYYVFRTGNLLTKLHTSGPDRWLVQAAVENPIWLPLNRKYVYISL